MSASVGVLMLGTVAAQIVSFLAAPILSRLFGPDAYGEYGLFIALTTLIGSIIGGRLELAVSLPRQDRTSKHIAEAGRWLALASALLALMLIVLTLGLTEVLLVEPNLPLWLLVIPLAALLTSWNSTYAQQNLRALQFATQARLRFMQSLFYAGIAVFFGWVGFFSLGLITATIVTQTLILMFHMWRSRQLMSGPRQALAVVRRYKDFPTKQVPATLIETGTVYLPILFIAPQFGSNVAGYFFFAQTVLRQPVAFFSNSIGEIFRQWLSRQVADDMPALQGTIKTLLLLAALSVSIFAPIIMLAPWLVPWLFGSEWSGAVAYFQIFGVISAFQFVASPISPAFFILARQQWDVILQSVTAGTLLITLSLAVLFDLSAIVNLTAFALVYLCRYTVQVVLSLQLIMRRTCG